jgi:ABC-type uncharacterized transport system permease subunit
MTPILPYLALGFYAASLFFYVRWLAHNRALTGRLGTLVLAGGLLVHYLALLQRAKLGGSVPYHDLYGSMSLFAWFLAATYLGMERFHRQRSLGPFVIPFIIVLTLAATVFAPAEQAEPPARGPLFAFHVTSNILAYAAFALSFVMGVIYLAQNRLLRFRKPGTLIWQFPALEVVERMMRSSVIVGLVGLAIGASLGMIWLHRLHGQYFTADAKEIVSAIIFVVYAAYLWLSSTTEWRGPRATVLCVANFLVVIFSYTVVNLFLSKFHNYF